MQLVFGKGDILVTDCGNNEVRHILFEQGKGSGKVGTYTGDASRQVGATVSDEDIADAAVTLTFNNPVSLGVVLEKVLSAMLEFRRVGRTIGEDNADLGTSIREECEELLGMRD